MTTISPLIEPTAKPFLKWAGGKGQLINQIQEYLPEEYWITGSIERYIEPFAGGGALFFWLSQNFDIQEAFLFDINPEIVTAYKTIKTKVHVLMKVYVK
ncbi:MAG: DNA adenine methylase [Candidatus Omnitrophica bacterium]|nr:DNA adenine methylase [Candidatus Omnitrophota bacterium]